MIEIIRSTGDLQRIIEKAYRAHVAKTPMPEGLRAALQHHERVPAFVVNLSRELMSVRNLKEDDITSMTNDLTDLFIKCVQTKADERVLSQAAKDALREKNAQEQAIDDEDKDYKG